MKKFLLSFFITGSAFSGLWAQGVGVNTDGSNPDPSAILDVKATDKGLLVPRVHLTDVTSQSPITSPATGLLVYNTNPSVTGGNGVGFYVWLGSSWSRLDMSNSGDWRLTGNAGINPATHFLGTTGPQDLVFRTDNAERMRILSGGDVGIGTSSPTHRLHVNGAVRAENGFLANDGTAGVPAYRFNADTDVGMFRPAANQIGFAMDGVEKVRFNGNAADVLVGINTTAPTAPIDFVRTTDNSMLVGTNYGNAPNYDFRRAQGTPGAPTVLGVNGVMARLRAFGYDGAAFQPAAQITFEVDASSGVNDMPGRIQFFTTPDGSTTPQERMRINNAGVIRFNAYTTNGILKTSGGDGTLVTGAVNLASTEVTGILPVANGGTGVSSIPANAVVLGNGTSPITTVAPGAAGNVLMSNGTTWTSTSGSGQFILNQNATDQTGNFRITGTGRANTSFESPVYTRADAGTVAIRPNTNSTTAIQLQNAGGTSILNVDATNNRVGIGTTAPTRPLHVSAGGTQQIAAVNPSNVNNTEPAEIVFDRTAVAATQLAAVGVSGTGRDFFIWVNGSDRVNITETGLVGIGTSNPAARLTVVGDGSGTALIGGGFCGGNYTGISLNGQIGNCGVYNFLSSPTDQNLFINRPTGHQIIFRENNNTQMVIASGGNVGIGTAGPTQRLEVHGDPVGSVSMIVANTGDLTVGMDAFASGTDRRAVISWEGVGGVPLTFRSNVVWNGDRGSTGSEVMRITSGGLVGIGTTNPLARLHVGNGLVAIGIPNGGGSFAIPNTCGGNWITNATSGIYSPEPGPSPQCGDEWYIASYPRSGESRTLEIAIKNDPDDHIALMPSGFVGVGTTTPENYLHVVRPSGGGNRAVLQLTSPGDNSWGHLAVLRTTGAGQDGARLLFHSRGVKNWSIGGQENSNNFGIWEDGGDGVYGSGFGTQRFRIEPGGAIFGKFRHVTYHSFNNASWTGNPGNRVLWFPCPGGDGCDDTQIGGTGTPGNDHRREWVAPFSGRIVRIVIRVGNDSGSNPEFRGRPARSINGGFGLLNTNTFEANENNWTSIDCNQNNTFNRGDRIAIGVDMNCGSCYFEDTNYFVAIIWEFDIWD